MDEQMRRVTVEDVLDRLETIADQHSLWATEAFETGEEKERYSHQSVADVINDEVRYWRNRLDEVEQCDE